MEIFTLAGQLVRSSILENVSAGRYGGMNEDGQIRWDGRNQEGKVVVPGMYLYRLVVDLDPNDSVVIGSVGVAW